MTSVIVMLQLIAVAGWIFFVVDAFRTCEWWIGTLCLCTPFWLYYAIFLYEGAVKWWVVGLVVGAEVITGGIVQTYGS